MSGSDSFLDLDSTLVGEDQRLEPLEEDAVDTVCGICGSVLAPWSRLKPGLHPGPTPSPPVPGQGTHG